jgi:hypothetical protein
MRTNSIPVTLPIVTSGGPTTTAPIEVGAGYEGFTVQFLNVGAAAGVQYAIEASLDGQNWFDITDSLRNLVGGAAVAAPITADSVYDYPARFPGSVHIACKHAPTAVPTTRPTAIIAFQDTTHA